MSFVIKLRKIAILTLGSSSLAMGTAPKAAAYPIDCAILLCLSGGWAYPSPDCAVAQIEFMRRITPWPIEPPVQIWNCPLKSSYTEPQAVSPMQRLYDINFPQGHRQLTLSAPATVPAVYDQVVNDETDRLLRLIGSAGGTEGDLSSSNQTADVDISSATFDFLRSIKVYDIRYRIKNTDNGYCYEYGVSNRGSYGLQGDFGWDEIDFDEAPSWAVPAKNCPKRGKEDKVNGVCIEWTDYSGTYGYDFITY